MKKSDFPYRKKGVVYLTQEKTTFSTLYVEARKKEHRILDDKDLRKLPLVSSSNPNAWEWNLRNKSAKRFMTYLNSKFQNFNLLDVGCGNGWFTNLIAESNGANKIIGLDINTFELEQAARVFNNEKLEFIYGDIFRIDSKFHVPFDIITLNASVQYFSDFKALMSKLLTFIKPNGEIHILDSPFYREAEMASAKKRTHDYYTLLGVPNMAANYYHHNINNLENFEILYNPKNILFRLIGRKDSPFCWFKTSIK
ncbi:class I SAM-dependent methyltransferase [Flavobacteriaceae bacterium LMO-SS05]